MAGPGSESAQEDRTEAATSFRREEFRKQGIVAQSRELMSVVLFLAAGTALFFMAGSIVTGFRELTTVTWKFESIEIMTPQRMQEWVIRAMTSWATMVAPMFGVVMVAAFACGVAQVGFHISTETLSPNWDRVNPLKGAKRLFSLDAVMEAAKATIKMLVVGGVAWVFLKQRAFIVGNYFTKSVPELSVLILGELSRLFFLLAAALGAFAAADFFYQRYKIEKQMRMTKQEIKEEYKLREGDPMVKQRVRAAQRKIARRRMMEAVPKADVIITNPTHYAVALQYDPKKMRSPKVVAKGVDFLALKIRELAKSSGVPIVENRPLARALYAQVPVGKGITEDLYTAVAQVLTYVYRLKGMTSMNNGSATA